ncbi:hypothetical protein OESDEN_17432 [Oesophagostomum dentatum]|uniref:GSKIP domain-containing protein n=1 Tax=Oesophagostomum dentatum TaxID=61180 RepID=A0A0B1SC35_OESDE|nr:hypothetical protein OESDEN_17432 [Oesophagostomum dentatum]
MLPRTPDLIFVNLTTIEDQPYCLELTHKGWRITSLRLDCMVGDFTRLELFTKYYDSLFSLMDTISPGYRARFGEKLALRLKMLEVRFFLAKYPFFLCNNESAAEMSDYIANIRMGDRSRDSATYFLDSDTIRSCVREGMCCVAMSALVIVQ